MPRKKSKGNGQGSVYPRKNKDGKITGYLGAYYGPDGKRRYVSAKSKSECERKLRAAMADADKGLVFDAGTLTVTQYLDNWLGSIEGTVSDRTYEGYAQMVSKHLAPTIGKNKLKTLTPNHVRAVYKQKQRSLSPRTVQYIHVTLHKALRQAVLDGLIPRNVTEAVRPPKVIRDEVRPLSQDEAKQLLAAAIGTRLEALYIVALHTGLRQGELLRLKWSDLDGDKLSIRGTKSQGSRRVVKLSQTALDALRSHRKRQLGEKLKARDYEDSGLIFPTQSGRQMDRHNLWRQFKRLLKRADLPEIPFHNLRHTCATILFQRGTHPKLVQQLLGHASIKITLDTYSHYIEGYDGGLGDTMDEALG